METKVCSKCKRHKSLAEFSKQASAQDGHKSACKSCNKASLVLRNRAASKEEKSRANELLESDKSLLERYKLVFSSNIKKYNPLKTISISEYAELVSAPCFYCGGKLPKTGKGLDRIDSSRGYEKDNVVPCCRDCNVIKSDFTLQKLAEVLPKILLKVNSLLERAA